MCRPHACLQHCARDDAEAAHGAEGREEEVCSGSEARGGKHGAIGTMACVAATSRAPPLPAARTLVDAAAARDELP